MSFMNEVDPEDIVEEAVAEHGRIKDPDDVVGLCTECKNVMEPDWMVKNVFAQEGVAPACRYCGGVVTVTYREIINDNLKNQLDARRGLGQG